MLKVYSIAFSSCFKGKKDVFSDFVSKTALQERTRKQNEKKKSRSVYFANPWTPCGLER